MCLLGVCMSVGCDVCMWGVYVSVGYVYVGGVCVCWVCVCICWV